MAEDWIKMRCDLRDTPEVIQIGRMTKTEDRDLIVGKLHRLWSLADQQTVNGELRKLDFASIDYFLGVEGFCEALKAVGWLRETSGGSSIPNFEIHNGKSAKRRAKESRRKSKPSAPEVRGNGAELAPEVRGVCAESAPNLRGNCAEFAPENGKLGAESSKNDESCAEVAPEVRGNCAGFAPLDIDIDIDIDSPSMGVRRHRQTSSATAESLVSGGVDDRLGRLKERLKRLRWPDVMPDAIETCRVTHCMSEQDRSLCAKSVALCRTMDGLDFDWLADSREAVKQMLKRGRCKKTPSAYFFGVLKSKVQEREIGISLKQMLVCVTVPNEVMSELKEVAIQKSSLKEELRRMKRE